MPTKDAKTGRYVLPGRRRPSGESRRPAGGLRRRQLLRRLAEAEEDLSSLLASARGFAVYQVEVDPGHPHNGRVTLASPSARQETGLQDPLDIDAWFAMLHPEDLPRVAEANRRGWASGETLNVEFRYFHAGLEQWRHGQVVASSIAGRGGATVRATGIFLDVTERRLAQEERERFTQRLEREVRSRTGQLAGARDSLREEVTRRQQAERMALVQRDLGMALGAAVNLKEAVRLCLEAAIELGGLECGGVYLADEHGALELVDHLGLSDSFARAVSRYGADSLQARLVMSGQPVYLSRNDLYAEDLNPLSWREGLTTQAVVPVRHQGRVVACLNVASRKRESISELERYGLDSVAASIGSALSRIRASEALRASEKRLRDITDNSGEWIWECDHLGRLTYASPLVVEIMGYAPEEVVGRHTVDFMSPDFAASFREILRQGLESPEPARNLLIRHRHRDGREVVVECNALPIFDGAGSFLGYRGSSRDITRRVRSEERLRDTAEQLSAIYNGMADGVLILRESDLVILGANHALGQMLGHDPDDLEGRPASDLDSPDHLPVTSRRLSAAARSEGPAAKDVPFRRADQGLVFLDVSCRHVTYGGQPCLVAILRDSSERRRGEEMLRQMAAGVAHNFNNVLMAVLGNTQAAMAELAGGAGPAPSPSAAGVMRLLENVVAGAAAGRDMVKRLGSFVDSESGERPEQEPLEIGELLRTAWRMARAVAPAGTAEGVRCRWRLAPGLYVRGARGELVEVFLNLIKNAMEAMGPDGDMTVEAASQGGEVMVQISDSGPGLAADVRARLFEPFFTTKGVAGQGLGLASSQGIVHAHGGRIQVASPPGAGAAFQVLLPAAGPEAVRCAGPAQTAPPGGGRVLLVEDEAIVAMGLAATLEQAGHRVRQASGVSRAAAALAEECFDLVLCDVGLPDGSGWDVVRALAERDAARDGGATPLVFLTGWSESQLPDQHVESGPLPLEIIHKPVERSELLAVVRRAMVPPRTDG